MLKVFLTKAEYTTGNKDFTYNATDQGLTINSNTITAADKLDAYNNANSLLTATQNKNAGEGYLGIYSQQIAASGKGDTFDPNNLGYDIDVTYDIKKRSLILRWMMYIVYMVMLLLPKVGIRLVISMAGREVIKILLMV